MSAPITVRVQADDFDINAEIEPAQARERGRRRRRHLHRRMPGGERSPGGAGTGALSRHGGGRDRRIADEAATRWPLAAVTVIHRHGTIAAGDNIVLVVVASAHRHAAFEAAGFLMDYMKSRAPFWKKEHLAGGAEGGWVEAQAADDRGR